MANSEASKDKRAVPRGPTAEAVAANIKAIRGRRNQTQQELAASVSELGRPMLATAIAKIEAGERRADVDDLVTLALALNVSPLRLLLSDTTRGDEVIDLTPTVAVTGWSAWNWATGDGPIHNGNPEPVSEKVVRKGSSAASVELEWSPQVAQATLDYQSERPLWMRAPEAGDLWVQMQSLRFFFGLALSWLPGRRRVSKALQQETLAVHLGSVRRHALALADEAQRLAQEGVARGQH